MFSRSRIIIISLGLIILIGLVYYATRPKAPKAEDVGVRVDSAEAGNEMTLGFYNVENLFDTINDPLKIDEEFLPSAEKEWTSERFEEKIIHIGSVISELGDDLPGIVGLCEIENRDVLEDLVATPALKPGNYKIVHYESPDKRGIDVAMIYSANQFKPIFSKPIRVVMPDSVRPTRDILYVKGKVINGPELHLFVNHWPSRYRGLEISRPLRIMAATTLRHALDSVLNENPDANIICMGDFNDYPHNRSLQEVLSADSIDSDSKFVNLMAGLKKTKRGSYNYRGNWDFLDQFIVDRGLVDGEAPDIIVGSTAPYHRPEMLYKSEKYGDIKTNRTYGGTHYYGGYSDHLPIYTKLEY